MFACGVECVSGLLLVSYVKLYVFLRVLCVITCLCVLFIMYRVVLRNVFVFVCLCVFGCLCLK